MSKPYVWYKLTNTLLEIEENPFLSIEQPKITIIPTLQKSEDRIPGTFMGVLWNPGEHTVTSKRNTTISYVKESNYIEKIYIAQQDNIGEVTKIPHEKLPPMPETSAFMFYYNFYPYPG